MTDAPVKIWTRFPPTVLGDVKEIVKTTRKTGREASLTVCRRPGRREEKVFTGAATLGGPTSTDVMPCATKYGITERVGDVHTHPVNYDTIGIIPSEADLTGYIRDSYEHKTRQIGCVTNHFAPYIICMQPKMVPDRRKKNAYEDALDRNPRKISQGIDSYYLDNVARDFTTAFYDRETGRYVPNPPPREVMKSAFTRAGRYTKGLLDRMDRGAFCDYFQDLTVPENDEIGLACREELKDKEFLGVEYEKYLRELDKHGITDRVVPDQYYFESVPKSCYYKAKP
jgi:hypothetical protein